jgi:hypothetical protein
MTGGIRKIWAARKDHRNQAIAAWCDGGAFQNPMRGLDFEMVGRFLVARSEQPNILDPIFRTEQPNSRDLIFMTAQFASLAWWRSPLSGPTVLT